MIDKTSRSSQHVNPLDAAVIAQGIQREVGDRITVVDSITSTNSPLLNERDRYPHGSVLFADHQTAGRGRRGKTWVSPPGVNVYLSIAWDWRHGLASIGGLSSAIGIAMIEALTLCGARDLQVKWPNDVLWQQRKLCGILIESALNTEQVHKPAGESVARIVAGIGVNVLMQEAPEIDQPWTTLQEAVGGNPPARNEVAANMARVALAAFARFEADGLGPTKAVWPRYDFLNDQPVWLHRDNTRTAGIARGLADDGSLCVEVEGVYHYLNAGEVSIRSRHS